MVAEKETAARERFTTTMASLNETIIGFKESLTALQVQMRRFGKLYEDFSPEEMDELSNQMGDIEDEIEDLPYELKFVTQEELGELKKETKYSSTYTEQKILAARTQEQIRQAAAAVGMSEDSMAEAVHDSVRAYKETGIFQISEGLRLLRQLQSIRSAIPAQPKEECPECWGTGLKGGFHTPCSHGCPLA